MTDATEQAILSELATLSASQKLQVLDYIRSLTQKRRPPGVPGRSLLPFGGTISQDDLEQMAKAIEEDCEQVDTDEW